MAKWFSIESKHKKSFVIYEQYEHGENQQKFTKANNFRDGDCGTIRSKRCNRRL